MLTPYQRRLLVLLSAATFFDGFDMYALSQVLPNLRRDLGLSREQGGLIVSVVHIGAVLAYFLVRKADEWGRRRVLLITISGYTLCSLLTGIAPSAPAFALFQSLARVFLIAELAVATIYAAEEFPAEKRGLYIGLLQVATGLGGILCASTAPLLLKTSLGWRSVYFVGAVPLVLFAIARRGLRETERFLSLGKAGTAGDAHASRPPLPSLKEDLFRIVRTPYRNRMLLLGLIWALTYLCTANVTLFWKEYVVAEHHFTDGQVGLSMALAACLAALLLPLVGRLLDRAGRRRSAVLIYGTAIFGVLFAFSTSGWPKLTLGLFLSMFAVAATQPLLHAFNTELFPTELRGDAFAWSNNLLGRLGPVFTPYLLGLAAEQYGWGSTIRVTIAGPILALLILLATLPETSGRELEATSTLGAPPRS